MIFLSYSREDRAVAIRLGELLGSRGVAVARDPTLVQGDPFWRETVWRTLAQTRLMVVLWSRHAARSPWVDQEIRGFSGGRLFLPVDGLPLPPCAPARRDPAVPGSLVHEVRAANAEALAHPSPHARDVEAEVYRQRSLVSRAAGEELLRFRRAVRERKRAPAHRSGAVELPDGTVMLRICRTDTCLAATPVTNAQFRRFIDETGFCPAPPTWSRGEFARPELPVTGVTWFEAAAYAAWAGGRLPTAGEWTRAARGDAPDVEFATWSGSLSADEAHFGVQPGQGAPVAATAHRPSTRGFYGMCGNTWDWCSTADATHRVIRGGGYMDSPRFCRIRARYRNTPIDRDCCVGFRVLVDLHR